MRSHLAVVVFTRGSAKASVTNLRGKCYVCRGVMIAAPLSRDKVKFRKDRNRQQFSGGKAGEMVPR